MILLLQIMLYKVYVHCKDVVKMPVKASAEKKGINFENLQIFWGRK
jgi:hypothetical protein